MLGRLWRTSGFRLALGYTLLFLFTAVVVGGFVYVRSAALLVQQTDETIGAEIRGLEEQYAEGGVRELAATVNGRTRRAGDSLYFLGLPQGPPLAGNLDRLPEATPDGAGWLDFTIQRFNPTRPADAPLAVHAARGRLFSLREGLVLLVGRDIQARRDLVTIIEQALIVDLAATVLLGLGGGLVAGRRMLRRVDAASGAAREIMTGDLSRRLPRNGTGDELDRLSETLNRMLDRMERLMVAMREVTDNVAHDLRTPLTRLRARAEQALVQRADPADTHAALEEIVAEADRLLAVFSSLLSIARLESGNMRERLVETNLTALVEDVAELYGPIAEQQGVTFETDLAADLYGPADRQLLAQAVINLVENALKYGRPSDGPARLTLSLRADGAKARIGVADNGPGIPVERHDAVLRRFVRLDDSRSDAGAGLGLSLVNAVAGAHDGSLELRDTSPGRACPGLAAVLTVPRSAR